MAASPGLPFSPGAQSSLLPPGVRMAVLLCLARVLPCAEPQEAVGEEPYCGEWFLWAQAEGLASVSERFQAGMPQTA